MFAPSLRPRTQAPAGCPIGAFVGGGSVGRLFDVARAGSFAGRRFAEGELALVGGPAEEGDWVVLVARGPGRPRLGRVRGRQLLGDHGEPCLSSRWEVAGKLLGVVRPVGAGWAIEHLDTPGVVGMAPSAAVEQGAPSSAGGREVRPAKVPGQLSLFAA